MSLAYLPELSASHTGTPPQSELLACLPEGTYMLGDDEELESLWFAHQVMQRNWNTELPPLQPAAHLSDPELEQVYTMIDVAQEASGVSANTLQRRLGRIGLGVKTTIKIGNYRGYGVFNASDGTAFLVSDLDKEQRQRIQNHEIAHGLMASRLLIVHEGRAYVSGNGLADLITATIPQGTSPNAEYEVDTTLLKGISAINEAVVDHLALQGCGYDIEQYLSANSGSPYSRLVGALRRLREIDIDSYDEIHEAAFIYGWRDTARARRLAAAFMAAGDQILCNAVDQVALL